MGTIFIIGFLWLLVGYTFCKITRYAWEVNWYESFGVHYVDDSEFFNQRQELINIIICSLGGIITAGVIVALTKSYSSESMYYYKKSLGMVFRYNREKVEKHYGTSKV
jgi:hypothetical protein